MRVGIFGGTFDPIHYGHLLLAETCREQSQLDELLFVPTAVSPHKQHSEKSGGHPTPQQRIEMVQLAISGHPAFEVSEIEAERGGVSYTVDTLECFARERPEASLFLLMGADSLEDFPSWRNPARICELAIPLVVRRPGAAEPDYRLLEPYVDGARRAEIEKHAFESPLIELSSTDLRKRVGAGRSIRYRTPRAVEQYIRSNRIYQSVE